MEKTIICAHRIKPQEAVKILKTLARFREMYKHHEMELLNVNEVFFTSFRDDVERSYNLLHEIIKK